MSWIFFLHTLFSLDIANFILSKGLWNTPAKASCPFWHRNTNKMSFCFSVWHQKKKHSRNDFWNMSISNTYKIYLLSNQKIYSCSCVNKNPYGHHHHVDCHIPWKLRKKEKIPQNDLKHYPSKNKLVTYETAAEMKISNSFAIMYMYIRILTGMTVKQIRNLFSMTVVKSASDKSWTFNKI